MDRDNQEPNVSEIPGEKARKHVDRFKKFGSKSTHYYPFVWSASSDGDGPFCKDVDGNVLMDYTSHVGTAILGYNNKHLMEKIEDYDVVDPFKIYGQGIYYNQEDIPSSVDLMEKLSEVNDYGLNMVFLSNSGAEAVENSIKICYDESEGDYGVCFSGSFHGRTLGALSLNRSKSVYRKKFPKIPGVEDVPFCNDRGCDKNTCDCGFFTKDSSVLREKIKEPIDPEDLAYIILEPIQGEGGFSFPSDDFMKEINDISQKHDINIIADEIQSGMGRTGEMWAVDHYPIEPDVISSAKALRVGATLANEDTFPDKKKRLSSTWGAGDILASAVGVATIEVIQENNLLENAREKGDMFKNIIRDMKSDKITDVRGKGLMIGVELETADQLESLTEKCFQKGLLVAGCGKKTLRIMPSLDIREREVEMGCNIIEETLNEI